MKPFLQYLFNHTLSKMNPAFISQFIQYPYKLDTFQIDSIQAIYDRHHVLVTAHTSAGKSTIAEFAIAYFTQQQKKVIYTSPIKALSNQKFNDIKHQCGEGLKFPLLDPADIGILTGDFQINAEGKVIVATTEIIYNYLYSNLSFFDNVGAVIFDEVHYISDPERGHVWEGSIAMMPPSIVLVMLSATIPRAEEFANWVSDIKQVRTHLVGTDYRPVPLTHSVYWESSLTSIYDGRKYTYQYEAIKTEIEKQKKKIIKKATTIVYESVFYLSEAALLPAFYFCFSRKQCHVYAKSIKQSLIVGEVAAKADNRFTQLLEKHLCEQDRFIDQVLEIKGYLSNGVAIHHSGLLPILKEIIEILFSEGYIRVLFVTETFAVGINMPSKCVVMTSLEKHDGHTFRILRTDEYQQIAGRAGRRGLDTIGHCILLPLHDLPDEHTVKYLISGEKPSVTSRFEIDRLFILQCLMSPFQGLETTIQNTLQHRDIQTHILQLEQQQQSIGEKLSRLEQVILLIRGVFEQYQVMDEKRRQCKQVKEKRRIEKQMEEIKENYNPTQWDVMHKTFETIQTLTVELQQVQRHISSLQTYERDMVNGTLQMMVKEGYLQLLSDGNEDSQNYIKLYSNRPWEETLTLKGQLVCMFHECPPFLMTELLLNSSVFDSVTECDLAGLLAYLIEEKEKHVIRGVDLEETDHTRATIIDTTQDELHHLQPMLDEVNRVNEQVYHTFESAMILNHSTRLPMTGLIEVSRKMVQYGYFWSMGKSIVEIMTIVDSRIDYGNFVKHMMKLYNMIQEVKKVCNFLKRDELERKLIALDTLILRDIVHIDSIYLI